MSLLPGPCRGSGTAGRVVLADRALTDLECRSRRTTTGYWPSGLAAFRLVIEPNCLLSPACLAASLAASGHRTS